MRLFLRISTSVIIWTANGPSSENYGVGFFQWLVNRALSGAAGQLVRALHDGRGVIDEEAKQIRNLIQSKQTK